MNKQNGFALVMTLMVMALIAFSLVSYLALLSIERTGANDFLNAVRLQTIADAGAQEAVSKIMDGLEPENPETVHATAAPGMMEVLDYTRPAGAPSFETNANPRRIPLYSYAPDGSDVFDFNTPRNPLHPGEPYLTGYPEAVNPAVRVHWIEVKNPDNTNDIVGRYAYWVDVENSKINLNAASRPFDGTKPEGEHFQWWLGGTNAIVAGNSVVDWRAVLTNAPDNTSRLRLYTALTNYLSGLNTGRSAPFNFWPEINSILNSPDRKTRATLRKNLGLLTTVYGDDDERDPLKGDKMDLADIWSTDAGRARWTTNQIALRLSNPNFHRAYVLTGNTGALRSFRDLLDTLTRSGNAYLRQLLVNMAEYGRRHTDPPYFDESAGIIGAKSIPYVAEIATRARSALFLLPENQRRLETFFENRELKNTRYLTNVLIDIAIAFTNPNPFATNSFNGTIQLHFESSPSADYSIPIHQAVYHELGEMPGSVLASSPFKLRGWDIRQTSPVNAVFHRVPLPHPGQSGVPVPWHNAFRPPEYNGIPLGSFTPQTIERFGGVGTRTIYLNQQCLEKEYASLTNAVAALLESTRRSDTDALVERVVCIDPTLGHRTGYSGMTSIHGYTGNPWRHFPWDRTGTYQSLTEAFENASVESSFTQSTPSPEISRAERETNDVVLSAPRGEPMTSLGELGFVHSGLLCTPVQLDPHATNALCNLRNGAPMRMLLDILSAPGHSRTNPRSGTWNVNTAFFDLDGERRLQNRGWEHWLNFIGAEDELPEEGFRHFNSDVAVAFTNGISAQFGRALYANQISTLANTFTIHLVAQTLRNNAVRSEKWFQIVLTRDDGVDPARYRVVHCYPLYPRP